MEECMDWNGILGVVIALGIITLVFWGMQPLMDFLERLFLSAVKLEPTCNRSTIESS
jgi:hypothetical protein